jgi:hypothetical protein
MFFTSFRRQRAGQKIEPRVINQFIRPIERLAKLRVSAPLSSRTSPGGAVIGWALERVLVPAAAAEDIAPLHGNTPGRGQATIYMWDGTSFVARDIPTQIAFNMWSQKVTKGSRCWLVRWFSSYWVLVWDCPPN